MDHLASRAYDQSRRRFIQGSVAFTGLSLLSACSLATPPSARVVKVPRIGVLWSSTAAHPLIESLRQGLQDLGYVEGQTISVEWRFAEGQADRYASLATDLAGLPLDVIVVDPGTVTAMREATATIPIVFGPLGDPVNAGLIQSLAHPGANVTGMSLISPQLAGKRVELFKEIIPRLRSIAAIWNPRQGTSMAVEAEEAKIAADRLGILCQSLQARDDAEIRTTFQAATDAHVDGLVIIFSPLFLASTRQIVELAASTRLPAIAGFREFADAGGLMAYGPSLPELWRHTATYVDKILKGARPADLPVEQASRFELVINLKSAQDFGLAIPQSVLDQTTEVIS